MVREIYLLRLAIDELYLSLVLNRRLKVLNGVFYEVTIKHRPMGVLLGHFSKDGLVV